MSSDDFSSYSYRAIDARVTDSLRLLLPAPKQAEVLESLASGSPELLNVSGGLAGAPALNRLRRLLSARARDGEGPLTVSMEEARGGSRHPEAYELNATGSQIKIRAARPAGHLHGLTTLCQWLSLNPQGEECPGLYVMDEPDLSERGVMLDISRDRVPTLATACSLVELFSSWKINRLQLYTEHTFAYSASEHICGPSSPWTPAEIQALDHHARLHGIELVPNQQSFGHMHRWLSHASHRHLAEVPEGVQHPFHAEKQPFSLCPTDPESLQFLAGLYDELLPNFSSHSFNVCLDETFDLGLGRSKEAVEERGLGAVYLDFLRSVHELVSERGHHMQCWADVVIHHPEVARGLPEDCEPILWGYEAEHPIDEEAATLRESCDVFQIAPGTSSWQSLGGRTDNCIANLRNAAHAARTNSASGLLITDWGDRGHLQPLPVSYLGFLHGAECAWNGPAADQRSDNELALLLDHHAFHDPGAGLGSHSLALGRASDPCGVQTINLATLFHPIGFPERTLPDERVPGLDEAAFDRGRAAVQALRVQHSSLEARSSEASLAVDEFAWVLDLMDCACDLGMERLRTPPGSKLSSIPPSTGSPIGEQLRALGERHAALWLIRSRPGGLVDSVGRLNAIAEVLDPQATPDKS